ncbi:MAG: bifunctional glutamate N-acetyltransferase/amino-acid acetyltransferase ArgJ [Firmicutes bacterium]|jgi:glutamate N-acetyltransferase/amino-acid N-acetyltransferase|nr:bifunctional glutamate N-acetyltransferase/amino-acid acetyltransferase ArgJ [Bacillota bacterium]
MNADFKIKKIPDGGITSPRGFKASGIYCGLKKDNGSSKDLALIFSEKPAAAAGTFTRNLFRAAPVEISRSRIGNPISAVVVNSGNANACVGDAGYRDAEEMAALAAAELSIPADAVLVASTGVIGQRLPMERIREGIGHAVEKLNATTRGGDDAARAIMTTDRVEKKMALHLQIGAKKAVVGGMAKGSGMICPDMATMLAFITTDISMPGGLLQKALLEAVERTFNLVSVDGDTSTNDMVLLLANGAAGINIETEGPEYDLFRESLLQTCRSLSYLIAADGEGVTKVLDLTVKGAATFENARALARAVLNSLLVKTAFFGEDANWGRILAAMGYAGVDFNPREAELYIGPFKVAAAGQQADFDEKELIGYLRRKKIAMTIDLHAGSEEIRTWGNDLSHEYVKINSCYRT